jgi:serine/threonine protein kinase/TolB-like protein
MQSERWQNCTEIFNAAVERPRAERAALLEQSCHGDEALRRQVELLLKYHDQSGDFIDSPAFVVAPELLVDDPNALIGQHLGYYRIDAVLGIGGMGVVYLACDERLGRKVGLKLLPQSLVAEQARWERLKREARTASALNHPNIMTIHEVGEVDSTHYIATEFIEGTTLRERIIKGPIPPNEALDIAIQVASALCVAHGAGIVHRDVKPENIMLRPDGYVKVLDFGIAKFTQQETLAARTSAGARAATQQGMIMGTVRYMSPEQARGQTVDARSDLWSLGIVLYEMLAGRPPFEGETPTDVMAAVLLKDPEPVEQRATIVPPALQSVVVRSLQKDPAERYQTAEEMLSELRAIEEKTDRIAPAANADSIRGSNRPARSARWIGVAAVAALLVSLAVFYGWRNRHADRPGAPAPIEKGIAVLPFENLSLEKADAFFADSMQDDVLTSVGKIKDLKVIARTSVMDYRGARLAGKVREIGKTLGVSHVLEGSVRRVADRVVVNVALIDTRDERQVWSERYERTLTNALALQGELAVEIARKLSASLTPLEQRAVATKPTENPDAYLLYLRARELEIRFGSSNEDLETAVKLYQQAVDLDPKFALARARLSMLVIYVSQGQDAARMPKALAEAEEALHLQPNLGEGRLALAHYYMSVTRDFNRALAELARAAELIPNSPEVWITRAQIYKRQGKIRERIAALQQAETLDPRDTSSLLSLASTFGSVRNWPEAAQTVDRIIALQPNRFFWVPAYFKSRMSGVIDPLKKAIAESPIGTPPGDLSLTRYEVAMLERDFPAAELFLRETPAEAFGMWTHPKLMHEALLASVRGADPAEVERALVMARQEIEKGLADAPAAGDLYGLLDLHVTLGLIDAFRGRKEDAIREGRRAVELADYSMLEKNDALAALALIYARTGEPDEAIKLIEKLLTVPANLSELMVYSMTQTDLKWRWVWDPLRNDPRFKKILEGPEPKTIY